jgi:O-antigen/teichoic acid export membrane protein
VSSTASISYRNIVKATFLFGGVQVVTIAVNVIKAKFIAMILGPVGVGINGLLTNTLLLVASIVNFGLSTSAVQNIAEAKADNDRAKVSIAVSIVKKLVLLTGFGGVILTVCCSYFLSKYAFGNDEYTIAFALLSIAVFTQQINSGYIITFQGLHEIKRLTRATLWGSCFGVLITLPIYYFYRYNAIVPCIIATQLVILLFYFLSSRQAQYDKIKLSFCTAIKKGASIIKLGFLVSLGFVLATVSSYALQLFINRYGTATDLGFYLAGFNILNTYVGIIFSAMATEYFPRLSTINKDNDKCRHTVNQQAEIVIVLIVPILIAFFLFKNFFIVALYSKQFLQMSEMMTCASLGVFFKTLSWPIAYLFLAKGATKIYFWNEFISVSYAFLLNIIGYKLYGLEGLGYAFLITQGLYLIQCYLVSKYKFSFYYEKKNLKIFFIYMVLTLSAFLFTELFSSTMNHYQYYAFGILPIILSGVYSLFLLSKRGGFFSVFRRTSRQN